MADSVTITARPIYVEDFSQAPDHAQTTATILGLGPGIPVTPFTAAAGDAAAAGLGVQLGEVYVNTAVSPARLYARRS